MNLEHPSPSTGIVYVIRWRGSRRWGLWRRKDTGWAARPVSSGWRHSLSPPTSQLHGWIVLGYTRRDSASPLTACSASPCAFRPCRPTVLNAATKGTHGRLPPQFSSGRFSPTRDAATRMFALSALYGAKRQHPSACHDDQPRFSRERVDFTVHREKSNEFDENRSGIVWACTKVSHGA